MADRIYLDKLDEPLASVARVAFPGYHGRKFRLVSATELDVRSYWSGGSRDYFTCVDLATMRTLSMPPQSAFDRPVAGADRAPVPEGYIWVEHSIFCGKDTGLTFHVNPANLTKMLPGQSDESAHQGGAVHGAKRERRNETWRTIYRS